MIAANRKKIIKMTQGDRLFNVILIIFCFLTGLSNLFDMWNRPRRGRPKKIGVLVFRHYLVSEHSGTVPEHLKTPMNTRFSYTVLYVLYNIYKRVYREYRVIKYSIRGHMLYFVIFKK